MSVYVWRIATEAPTYPASDLSGTGAKISGGRWNSAGVPLVYCAGSVSLAVLETLSHFQTGDLPYNRCIVRVDIPVDVWSRRIELAPLPGGWDVIPHGISSCASGDAWVASMASALLVVPSAIVPEDRNVLINPVHPDSLRIKATTVRKWMYDPRLL